MSKNTRKNESGRKAINLYLPGETLEKARRLQRALRRPSISNVVEILIEDAARTKAAA